MTNENAKGVKEEIQRIISWMSKQELDEEEIETLVSEILKTQDEKGNNIKTIFLGGWGRSGYDAQAFAMRLAHLKFDARYITETTAPAMRKDDLFIVVSGSGESFTEPIITALKIGVKVIMITSFAGSIGARLADLKFIVPGREETENGTLNFLERQMKGMPAFPLGTAFELYAMIILDAVIAQLIGIKKKTEEDLESQHSNVAPV